MRLKRELTVGIVMAYSDTVQLFVLLIWWNHNGLSKSKGANLFVWTSLLDVVAAYELHMPPFIFVGDTLIAGPQ